MRASTRHRPRATPKESFLGRLLDPIDRLSESIFSILILLTFTLAFRIIKLGADPNQPIPNTYVNELLIGAAGATLAWGIIDGIMYALLAMFERGERHRLLRQLQSAHTDDEGVQIVANELDYILEPITSEQQRRMLYQDVLEHLRDGTAQPVRLSREDIAGGFGSVLVAVIAVLPSFVPFLIFYTNPALAIRVSNVVSFVVLFILGYQWGKHTGADPWRTGLLLAAIAGIMVLIAIPLGG
jgi:VIT1/CCC1 family predicted Fe2+/Mn2+ transporter